MPEPRFTHDGCGDCRYLGWLDLLFKPNEERDGYDVWACPQKGAGIPTVILRWGSSPGDYLSGRHYLGDLSDTMREAAIAAVPALGERPVHDAR